MPTPNSLAALKALLGSSSDLNAEDPNGMVAQESRASDNLDELKQHLGLEREFPHTVFTSAKAPTALAKQSSDLAAGPNFGVDAQARVKGINDANDAAMRQGFTGDTEIGTPLPGDLAAHPTHEQLYANVGDRSGLSPAARATRASIAAAAYKEDAPTRAAVAGKLAEGQAIRDTNQFNWNLQHKGAPGQAPTGQAPIAPPAPAAQPAPAGPPAPPKSFLGQLKDFALGSGPNNGPGSYNSLSDLMSAKGGRTLSGFAHTPETSAIQEALLGNAQSLAGIFPSSRAAGVLSKIAQDFQANVGNETPANSYARLRTQIGALDNAETEFDDPSLTTKFDAQGRMEMTNSNQTIQRAKIAVSQSRATLQRALQHLEQLYPGIGQSQPQQAPPGQPGAAPGGRFIRVSPGQE